MSLDIQLVDGMLFGVKAVINTAAEIYLFRLFNQTERYIVPAALKGGIKENINKSARGFAVGEFAAQTNYICVIMLPRQPRRFLACHKRRTHAFIFIRNHAHADSRVAYQYAEISSFFGNGCSHL